MANIPQWKVGDILSASKLNDMVDAINNLLADQTGNNDAYITLDELNDILKQYSDVGHTHSVNEIADLVLPTKLSQLQNDTSYVTEDYVTNAIANAQLGGDGEVDLSAYATKNYVDSEIDKIELTPGPKGEQGPKGETGEQGPAGADGKTPVKGVDYFTADDKVEMLDGYATETFVANKIAEANSKTVNENMAYIDVIKDNCETEAVINYGEDKGSRPAISTFSGWGTPFRKENVPQQNIYGYSTYVTVYDNSTNKNIMKNVELDLYLLSKETLETEQFSIVRKLASAVLIEPGEVKFDFTMAYEDWPDIFALFVYNTEGYNLLLNMGSLNSNYKDHDIACVYATGKQDIPTYFANSTSNYFITTAHKFYGIITFKPDLELESIPTQIYKNTTWDLPEHIYALEDDTLEMFTTGMVNSNIPYDYHMRWNGAVGALYVRKFMYTPVIADIGKTYPIRCELRDHAGFVQDVHNMTLHVEPKPSNPSTMKTILMIGDSLTGPGQWPHELYRRLVATDGDPIGLGLTNFQTIGRCEHNHNGLVVKYEGYGGWNYEHFYSNLERLKQYWITTEATKPIAYQKSVWKDGNNNNWVLETIEEGRMKFYRQDRAAEYILPESGSLVWVSGGNSSDNTDIVYTQTAQESSNPFWDDDEDVLNVQKFVESQGVSTVDYMICLLGWNQITNVSNVTQEAITFVNAMHEQMPNMKIILCGLQPPNPDGCAANYGLGYGNGYSNPVELRRQVAQYNDNLEQISVENDFVYFVHVSSQYDYEYGSISQSMEISKRYPTKVVQGVNGVHPGTVGYMQIADAIYRRFVAILNEDNNF